jgi:hypothetical protein
MAGRKKGAKPKQLPFGHKLVLNQWIVSLFGFDPLKDHKDGSKRSVNPPLSRFPVSRVYGLAVGW